MWLLKQPRVDSHADADGSGETADRTAAQRGAAAAGAEATQAEADAEAEEVDDAAHVSHESASHGSFPDGGLAVG